MNNETGGFRHLGEVIEEVMENIKKESERNSKETGKHSDGKRDNATD